MELDEHSTCQAGENQVVMDNKKKHLGLSMLWSGRASETHRKGIGNYRGGTSQMNSFDVPPVGKASETRRIENHFSDSTQIHMNFHLSHLRSFGKTVTHRIAFGDMPSDEATEPQTYSMVLYETACAGDIFHSNRCEDQAQLV